MTTLNPLTALVAKLDAAAEGSRELDAENEITLFCCAPPCDHDFQGWREFEDGRGGERVCTKCGMGAMEHTLRESW